MRTFKFNDVYIRDNYSLLGRNEYKTTIENKVDKYINDYYNGEKCVELGEKTYQVESLNGLLKKTKMKSEEVELLLGGDLQNQIFATNFSSSEFRIPLLGLYSACATFLEGIIIGSALINSKYINNCIVTSSAHNLTTEKQFRFPIEYGSIRKKVNTFTATGSVSALLDNKNGKIKVESATIGKVIDLNFKDPNNMGACMAPAAAEVIYDHLMSTKRKSNYYDLILTGDLGIYGKKIMQEYLLKKYKIKLDNVVDAGSKIFYTKNDEIAGASGPICLPLILFNKIKSSKYKKILLVGTGALHSQTSANLKLSVPGVAHAVSVELI